MQLCFQSVVEKEEKTYEKKLFLTKNEHKV